VVVVTITTKSHSLWLLDYEDSSYDSGPLGFCLSGDGIAFVLIAEVLDAYSGSLSNCLSLTSTHFLLAEGHYGPC